MAAKARSGSGGSEKDDKSNHEEPPAMPAEGMPQGDEAEPVAHLAFYIWLAAFVVLLASLLWDTIGIFRQR